MKTICVVPTNRPEQMAEFHRAWEGIGDWTELIVVEDGPVRTFGTYAWPEIEEELGDDAWIISRRDSAIRCFGLLMAYRLGADAGVTLDDDVRPLFGPGTHAICKAHLRAMNSHTRWVSTTPDLRPRGLPYRDQGEFKPVMANVGLWAGVPDQDAPQALLAPISDYSPPAGSRLVHPQQFIPVSGMNLAIKRDAIPLFYFPLMGEGQPYARMDDIWSGVIAQKCMRHLGWGLSYGEPHVQHRRASDPFVNLIKEAPGVRANETIWKEIDACGLTAREPLGCVREMGKHLERAGSDEYLRTLGRALQVWASLF